MKMTPTTLDRKTNNLRFFTFVLAVWLLIAAMPISAFAELLQIDTQPMQDPTVYVLAEDTTKRSEFEKHYYCSDGTFVAVTYPETVHYKNESGEWVDVDMRLASDAQAETYESQSGAFKTVFSKPATAGDASVMANGTAAATPTVSMQSGEYTLSWGLSGTKSTASAGTSTYALNPTVEGETVTLSASANAQMQVLGEMKSAAPALSIEKIPVTDPYAFALPAATNQVVYEDVFGADQNVSVRYSVSLNKIEEDILITAPTEMTSFSMQIECGELSPVKNSDNSIDFLDNYSNMVYHVSTPYLADAVFAMSYDVDVTLTEQDGVCTVTYTPDAEWMNAPEREYPILLDPAVTTNDYTAAIMDTYVVEDQDVCYETNQYLVIGQADGKGRAAIIHFSMLPQIDPSMPIISANLKLSTYIGPNGVDLKLESMASGFNLLLDDYSDWKTWNRTEVDRAIYTSGTPVFEFDMTGCITDLYTGNIGRDFSVSLYNEDATTNVPTIHSANTPFGDSYRPCLTVTYGYSLPAGLSLDDEITIQNLGSQGYLYPNSGLIGNGNSVLHAPGATSSDIYRLLTLRQNSTNGTYRLEYTPSSNNTGAYISANTTTKNVVMYNTTNVPSNIEQDWLIVPDSINTFKIVLASDMRYIMTADNATSGYVSVTQCTGEPTARQQWTIYKDGDPINNVIAYSPPIDQDYRYINNSVTGKFLKASLDALNTVGFASGRVNDLGDSIQWAFTRLPDGYYTIQNKAVPGQLLAGTGLPTFVLTTSNGTISNNQKWAISLGTTTYTITNVGTGRILAETGYIRSTWRMVKCSNYVELGTFSFSNLSLVCGETVQLPMPLLDPYPNSPGGAIHFTSTTSDFTYEVADASIAIVNSSTGTVTGIGKGETEVTVIHKVTGIEKRFTITVLKKVIFILPGIMGSQIYANQDIVIPPIFPDLISNTFEKDTRLWDPSVSNVLLIPEKIRALECSSSGIPVYPTCAPSPTVNYSEQNSEKQLGAQNTYQVLYQYVYEQCYDLGYDIILYEYDWRYDPYLTAIELSQYIQSNYYGDICFISHSMGGLVSSYYISLGEDQRNLVDKHISVGTPYLGAAKMIDVLLNGNALDGIIKQIATNISIHSVVGNISSIYGLMPYEEYFYPCVEYVNGLTKYECSTYNETITFMSNNISNWNSTLYETTVVNQDRLFINQAHITTLVDSYYIVGDNLETISSVKLNWNENFPESRTKTMSGDGTVTKQSATINQSLPSNRVLYAESDESIGLNATHIGLVESEPILDLICNIITANVDTETDEAILNDEYGVYTD